MKFKLCLIHLNFFRAAENFLSVHEVSPSRILLNGTVDSGNQLFSDTAKRLESSRPLGEMVWSDQLEYGETVWMHTHGFWIF